MPPNKLATYPVSDRRCHHLPISLRALHDSIPLLCGTPSQPRSEESRFSRATSIIERRRRECLGSQSIVADDSSTPHRARVVAEPIIRRDPQIQGGVPVFTGTRVPLNNLFGSLEAGDTLDQVFEDYPSVTREHALTALELARESAAGHVPAAGYIVDLELELAVGRPCRDFRTADELIRCPEWRAPPGRRIAVQGVHYR